MNTARIIIAYWILNCHMDNSHAFCWEKALEKYNVDPTLMASICWVESRWKPDAQNLANKNGTADYGLCQINSNELPGLAARGFSKKDLLDDPCLNVLEGARILAEKVSRVGATWKAVGAYNAGERGNPGRQLIYAQKVEQVYNGLLGKPLPRGPNANVRPSAPVVRPRINSGEQGADVGQQVREVPFVMDVEPSSRPQAEAGHDGEVRRLRYANTVDDEGVAPSSDTPVPTRRDSFVYTF